MKMKAKINFYTDKVGHHKNVMDFIGSIVDDQARKYLQQTLYEKEQTN